MTWYKVDDGWPTHPKFLSLSDAAVACWHRCLAYSSAHLTDGFIPAEAEPLVTRSKRAIPSLIERELLEVVTGGWRVAKYEHHNRTRAEVEERRQKDRERQRSWRESQKVSQRDTERSHASRVEKRREEPPLPPLAVAAVELWVEREMHAAMNSGGVKSPDGLKRSIRERADWGKACDLLDRFPSLSASELAGVLSGNVSILNQHRRSS